jgi:hypothetical protein
MAWEDRNGRMYYYRKRREGNRVISEYVGNNLLAQLASEQVHQDREALRRAQTKWLLHIHEFNEIEADLDYLSKVVCELVRATLLASGYHPHKGQWRKKRDV